MATMSEDQIVRVVAGESHTLALTGDGKVFAWGKGLFGRLGNGSDSDEVMPVMVEFPPHFTHTQLALASDTIEPPHFKIISIAAGAYHSLALTDAGAVWSWGYNIYGQLGHDFNEAIPHPLCGGEHCKDANDVSTTEGEHVNAGDGGDEIFKVSKVIAVEAGGMMSCAVDQCGVLWMWGHCPFPANEGSESPFTLSVCRIPRPVTALQGLFVTKVACGNAHVLAVVDNQYQCKQSAGRYVCYAWGSNTHGQLGLGDVKSRVQPQWVQSLDEQYVGTLSDVSCGAYHSAALTHNEKMGETASLERVSMCWTFGMGENGQLGHGSSQSLALPQMVESLPRNERVMAVSCGLFHMGIVTEGGGVWIWGMERGLGLCPGLGPPGVGGGDYMFPVRVTGSDTFAASHGIGLACGAAHSVLAVSDGAVWAWGRGQNGVLGTGQCIDSLTPCPVVWPTRKHAEAGTAEPNTGLGYSSSDHPLNQCPLQESGTAPSEQILALAQREICALTTELAATKRHSALLHAALYGPSESSNASDTLEVLKEWENMVSVSSYGDLVHLENFYRQARARVKEVLLQKKVENYCKQFMRDLNNEIKETVD